LRKKKKERGRKSGVKNRADQRGGNESTWSKGYTGEGGGSGPLKFITTCGKVDANSTQHGLDREGLALGSRLVPPTGKKKNDQAVERHSRRFRGAKNGKKTG